MKPIHRTIVVIALGATLALCLGAPARAADIYWNDGDGGSNTILGATWNDLQSAINSAQGGGAAGMVKISGDLARTAGDASIGDLEVTSGNLTISGGWDGSFTSQSLASKSVLNVNGSNTADNKFRVLTITGANTTVDNLQITGGEDVGIYTVYQNYGAGVFVNGADNTTLKNLRVTGNTLVGSYTANAGGGIAAKGSNTTRLSGLLISHCEVDNNFAQSSGGGIYLFDVGTNASPGVVEYTDVHNNTMGSPSYHNNNSGSGIAVTGDNVSTHVLIANSVIADNDGRGGALSSSNFSTAHNVVVYGTLIAGNTQQSAGDYQGAAGVYNGGRNTLYLANSTIADNVAASGALGAGLYADAGSYGAYSQLELVNSILSDNDKLKAFAASNAYAATGGNFEFLRSLLNETLYDKKDTATPSDETATTLAGALAFTPIPGFHSRDDSGTQSQAIEGNTEGDPLFLGSGDDPYQLTSSSTLAIDNGLILSGSHADFSSGFFYVDVNHNSTYDPALDVIFLIDGGTQTGSSAFHYVYLDDLAGNLRGAGSSIDRGAYEYQSVSVPEPITVALLSLGGLGLVASRRRR
ncbi:MAG: hypothetical protein BIFFINMI_01067 [Phycisphaerae bacterium]|nr:hypothetical protein [Phycisphaerae bacterium]